MTISVDGEIKPALISDFPLRHGLAPAPRQAVSGADLPSSHSVSVLTTARDS